jgi:hypothetical protein
MTRGVSCCCSCRWRRLLGDLSWVGGYLLIGLPTLALFYFAGWGLENLVRAAFRPIPGRR